MCFPFQIQEYDIANDSKKNPRERLARQKQNLRRRLGLQSSYIALHCYGQ